MIKVGFVYILLGVVSGGVAIVSGRTIDASLLDFDVVLDPASTRRHSGSVRGDSLVGNWVQASSVGLVAAGTFRAHRIRTQ